MTPIIEVKGLSKKYRIGENQPYITLRDTLAEVIKNPFGKIKEGLRKDEFWALKDINFTVEPGEVVGIIGRNGAGKSTLLKILSRITPPTEGEVIMRGRVGSLLEVGTGFQQELTGRENIFLNGAILGMTQREIKLKFDEIVDFAEVEKFIDTPVKHYSSGMYMRLAFSIAAHLDPEILIVDEVLAVGDSEFQKKCLGKMDEVSKKQGKTVLFVSHNLTSISSLCSKSIYLSNGRIIKQGITSDVIGSYSAIDNTPREIMLPASNSDVHMHTVRLLNQSANNTCSYDQALTLEVILDIREKKLQFYLGIEVINQDQQVIIFWRDIELLKNINKNALKGIYSYQIEIPPHSLVPGNYYVRLTTVSVLTKQIIEEPKDTISFRIIDSVSLRKSLNLPWRGLTSIPLKLNVNKLIDKKK